MDSRIAFHVGDLSKGTDPLRAFGGKGSHAFGSSMVIPARLEPKVPPGSIWATKDSEPFLRRAIQDKKLKAKIVAGGEISLRSVSEPVAIYWLQYEGEQTPTLPEPEKVEQSFNTIVRLTTLRTTAEYVDKFRIFTSTCGRLVDLKRTFDTYHRNFLMALRYRGWGKSGKNVVHADVLNLMANGQLKMLYTPTDPSYMDWVPNMRIPTGKRAAQQPDPQAGLAVYCLWSNIRGIPGVAIAADVLSPSRSIRFHGRNSPEKGIGSYTPVEIDDMYKPAPKEGNPPYRAILSSAVLETTGVSDNPSSPVTTRPIGVLNITTSELDDFTNEDCAWADAAAVLLGSLYQSFNARKQHFLELSSSKKRKKKKAKASTRRVV